MRIKRFVAEDMQGALNQVKEAFGGDALILQTRHFRQGGLLGFFGKNLVEVTAAAADDEISLQSGPAVDDISVKTAPRPILEKNEVTDDYSVKEEIQDIKSMLGQMMVGLEANTGYSSSYPRYFQFIYRTLKFSDVEDKLAQRLVNETMEKMPSSSWNNVELVNRAVVEAIASCFPKSRPISFGRGNRKKRIIALVGPTGVGKTTTIAKLAAKFSILEKKKVALITVDTYRVAAVEQLKIYADLLAVPMETAQTPKQLQDALIKNEDKELILVDTAGRSPLDEIAMAELKAFLGACPELEIFLVLCATTKQSDQWEIISRFGQLPVKQLIFTKLDETFRYGVILNVVNSMKKSLVYVTTGQDVPDDIETADPVQLAQLILQVNDHERSGRKIEASYQESAQKNQPPGF